MDQHTPGPWEAIGGIVRSSYRMGDSAHPGLEIASCRTWVVESERNANARLIAASPDLLSALRLAESFMAGFEGDELQDGIDERRTAVRAAIAKAEGRT